MLSLALSIGIAWQAQTLTPEALEHVKAGIQAQQSGQMKKAIDEFKKVTELEPDLAAAYVNLGAAYLQDHDYKDAIPPLKKSLEMKPNLVGAQQMLGYVLLQQGYAAEAIPHLESAHADDLLGIAEMRVGKLPEAIEHLNAALAKKPNDPELLYYLGRASGLLSKEAMDTLESAYPAAARSHQALGEGYAALRQVPESEKEYLEAIRVDPNALGIHLALGQLYATASEWAKAEQQFRAEAEMQPGDAEAAYDLGNALLQQGKVADAVEELQRSDHLRPKMPETLYALGKAQSLAGNPGAAEAAWAQLLSVEKTGPLAAQAHFGLAGLYRKEGKAADAAREMQQYERLK
jgi:tetratricopeptide (TPR) repeat protein